MNAQIPSPDVVLSQYTDELTLQIAEEKAVNLSGQDIPLYVLRTLQVLGRRHKNDPVLLSDDVILRQTAVYEAVRRILKPDLPEGLTIPYQRIFVFNHDRFFADTDDNDMLRDRMSALVEALQAHDGRALIYVDNLHLIIGSMNERTLYIGEPFRMAHARGELAFIGSTTLNNYGSYLDVDALWPFTRHIETRVMA